MDRSFDAIKFWRESSVDAFDTSDKLFESKKYNHSLFFVHLSLEKILKALYVQIKKDSPPPIHDLIRLAEKCEISMDGKLKEELAEISTFNVSARYDDYKLEFYKKATREYSEKWRRVSKIIFDKLLSQLS
jgi:HEPN domain-containing protein